MQLHVPAASRCTYFIPPTTLDAQRLMWRELADFGRALCRGAFLGGFYLLESFRRWKFFSYACIFGSFFPFAFAQACSYSISARSF
jgi:hypothetical protein